MVHDMHCRIFLFCICIFMFTSINGSVRVFYKMLHSLIPEKENNRMACVGFISIFSMPVGVILDQDRFNYPHRAFALTFFITGCFYMVWLAVRLQQFRDKFSPEEQRAIIYLSYYGKGMFILSFITIFAYLFIGGKTGLVPFLEWVLVIYFINYWSLLSLCNPYYDGFIHKDTIL